MSAVFLTELLQVSILGQMSEEAKAIVAGGILLGLNRFLQWFVAKGWKKGLAVDVNKIASTVEGLVTSQTTMQATIDEIKHEFEINGGGTVKAALLNLIDVQAAHATILMNASTDPAFQCDKKGNWSFANESLMELFGRGYPDLMKRRWLEGVPSVQERLTLYKAWKDCADEDIPFNQEVTIKNAKTGALYYCEIRAAPFRGKYNKKGGETPILFFYGKLKVIRTIEPGEGEVL